ncbi:hypothetical protein D1872_244100 [compost metagenome]
MTEATATKVIGNPDSAILLLHQHIHEMIPATDRSELGTGQRLQLVMDLFIHVLIHSPVGVIEELMIHPFLIHTPHPKGNAPSDFIHYRARSG